MNELELFSHQRAAILVTGAEARVLLLLLLPLGKWSCDSENGDKKSTTLEFSGMELNLLMAQHLTSRQDPSDD